MRSALVTLVALSLGALAACGGKIAPDPNAQPEPEPEPAPITPRPSGPSQGPPEAEPGPAPFTKSDVAACKTVCDRNARCGAWKLECEDDCLAEHRSACAADVRRYFQCYARTIGDEVDCAQLDPACEDVYCAYSRCTGRPLDAYCR